MKAKYETEKLEMDAWLKENDINVSIKDLLPGPDKERRGPGGMRGGVN